MTAKDDGWHVGASVFVHDKFGGRSATYSATVTKVGRKWVEFQREAGWRSKDDRFDHDTMRLDGGAMGWRGKVYLDEAQYIQEAETEKAWTDFVRRLPHRAPSHMTLASIARAAEMILGSGE